MIDFDFSIPTKVLFGVGKKDRWGVSIPVWRTRAATSNPKERRSPNPKTRRTTTAITTRIFPKPKKTPRTFPINPARTTPRTPPKPRRRKLDPPPIPRPFQRRRSDFCARRDEFRFLFDAKNV